MAKTIVDRLELPQNSFLSGYLAFASTLTDAPIEFHLGAGLTALSAAVGSKVVYPGFGGRRNWPNLYALLIAPSGLYRKSTAVGIAEDILQMVDSEIVLAGEQSREKFLSILQKTPNVFYPIYEFAALLSMWNRDYASGFKEIIVDLFDCKAEYSRQTIKDGKTTITKPALNILAASTLDWLKDSLKEGDLRGGLMGRFLIFPGINKGEDRGLNLDVDKELKQWLVDYLKELRQLTQSWIDVSPVLDEYNGWYRKFEKKMSTEFDSELIGFQSRVSAHTLKLAVLLSISEDGPQEKYVMSADNLNRAIILGEWLSEQAVTIARTGFTKSKTEANIQKLLAMAGHNGGVERSVALRLLHTPSRELDVVVQTAVERGEILILKDNSKTKPVLIYKVPDNKKPGD